ncbi:MAG: hypothetical protein F6K62_23675, partial [Sphaerospermopsis sp. SIO1G2]|nr:hypothetical protein [Sphaerospermopsis sp. SIO1G2]
MSTNNLELLSLEELLKNAQTQKATEVHISIRNFPYYRCQGILQVSSNSVIDDFTFWHWAKTIFSVEFLQH